MKEIPEKIVQKSTGDRKGKAQTKRGKRRKNPAGVPQTADFYAFVDL